MLQTVAQAAIFLAAKTEEVPRRVRDVVNVWNAMDQMRSKLPLEVMDYSHQVPFAVYGVRLLLTVS